MLFERFVALMKVPISDYRYVVKGSHEELEASVGDDSMKIHTVLSDNAPGAWIFPVAGAPDMESHALIGMLMSELEEALGSPAGSAAPLRIFAVLCGYRINALPCLPFQSSRTLLVMSS